MTGGGNQTSFAERHLLEVHAAMLDRVVTGGQTGADQAGWRAARAAGIPTGGWMIRGFLTETAEGRGDEPHPEFADLYGARELPTSNYADRTEANARDSDATIWFGSADTSGARATLGACRRLGRPHMLVVEGRTRPSEVAAWIAANAFRVLNVAGNRESKAPGIGATGERFLGEVFRQLGRCPKGGQ
jgi:hypothetical protein